MADEVTRVRYQPHDDAYRLDIEVVDAEELRARVASHPHRGFERVDFQCFVFVRSGTYTHTVDFETHQCAAGSCLPIGPGQVHRFGPSSDWDGWILIVGSHHIPEMVERLPAHVRTANGLAASIGELFERMTADATLPAGPAQRDELLALQARVLVSRLALGDTDSDPAHLIDPAVLQRYREYRATVDQECRRWHLVAPYARHLGCSAKSLNRACRAASDVTAKRVIVERIILEAKRVLAHTADPVAKISADLGFDEPTNFVKFFRRETDLTPAVFRATVRQD
jgi:AraC-like DNA-binding protein